ncbi:MAG: hypothetical protein U0821_00280 [Chloroflexota bacterium]
MGWQSMKAGGWAGMALLLLICLIGLVDPGAAQTVYEVIPLGKDTERNLDRYQVVIGAGGSFWDFAALHLPLLGLEVGDARVIDMLESAWRSQHPERGPTEVRPGDSFVMEVAAGTFVARSVSRQPDRLIFAGTGGDEVVTFPRDPAIGYRYRSAETPERAEVVINGGQYSALDTARRVYDVDRPDFIQVRTIRGALQERTTKLTVDLSRRFLDEFRQFRDRAVRVEDGSGGLRTYWFDRADQSVPFVRVDDAVGDETDPGVFPKLFRVAYYRDGTVRRYLVTESGDSLGKFQQPDNAAWNRVLGEWREWQDGQAEPVPPFAPALSATGALLPGRILVVANRPRLQQASPRPTGAAGTGSGAVCLGVPIGALLASATLLLRYRVW